VATQGSTCLTGRGAVGQIGEIYIDSPMLALEYLGERASERARVSL
jgi:hypothetical protein